MTWRPANTVWSEGIAQRAFRSVEDELLLSEPVFDFGSWALPVGLTSFTPEHSKGAGPFLMVTVAVDGASCRRYIWSALREATAEKVAGATVATVSPIANCWPTSTPVDTVPSPGDTTVSYL